MTNVPVFEASVWAPGWPKGSAGSVADGLVYSGSEVHAALGLAVTDLERYRRAAVAAACAEGPALLDLARRWLRPLSVTGLWLHGSVLDPERFREDSDVDLIVTVRADAPVGVLEDASHALHGRLTHPLVGVFDVAVVNLDQPTGRRVRPLKIA